MAYHIFTYPDVGRANAVCVELNKINDNFVFTTDGTVVSGTINDMKIKFTPPLWAGFCFTSDSIGVEFISFTKYTANTASTNNIATNMLIIANTGDAPHTIPTGSNIIYRHCNIGELSFNQQTKNIISPLVYDGMVINNLYISPTGLSPVKGTIVTDGTNKYISLENAIYAKYVE